MPARDLLRVRMPMPSTVATLLGGVTLGLGLGLGFGIGTLTLISQENSSAPNAAENTFLASADTTQTSSSRLASQEQRIAALEVDLAQSLEVQLELAEQLEQLQEVLDLRQASRSARMRKPSPKPDAPPPSPVPKNRTERRMQQLEDAGFDPDTIAQIRRREGEVRMAQLQSRYETMRNPEDANQLNPVQSVQQALREELGDEEYDRYLFATGQPNRVQIRDVIDGSPGQKAGIQAGDMILSYDNVRVFSMRDVVRQVQEGSAGVSVPVRVRRENGNESTVYLLRGPIGIWGGRGTREDPNEYP